MKNPRAPRRKLYNNDTGFTGPRDCQPTHISVVLFNIRRYVVMPNGHEPTVTEARELYSRWFGVQAAAVDRTTRR